MSKEAYRDDPDSRIANMDIKLDESENGIKEACNLLMDNLILPFVESKDWSMIAEWNANSILLDEILSYPLPENKTEAEKNLKSIIESAADKLHHTKSVSKSSYMNNKLLELYSNNIDKFKEIFKSIKKKHGGKLPNLNIILVELFIYLDNK